MSIQVKWLIVTAGAASCALEARQAPVVGTALRCSVNTVCGSNSPEVDHYGIHELEVAGLPNGEGIRIVRFSRHADDYELSVVDGRLRGTSPRGVLEGKDLTDAELVLEHAGTDYYVVRIREVGSAAFVVPPGDPIETYLLEWAPIYKGGVGEFANVCSAPPTDPTTPAGDEWRDEAALSGMEPTHSLVFEGDRIDATAKTIDPRVDPAWFNIGCAGHTLAKLHLTRNTWRSRGGAPEDSVKSRQAALKMLVADYCGTGTPFTVAGVKLVWENDNGMTFYSTPSALEARWSDTGALCLDHPRVATTKNPLAIAEFPDIDKAIGAECSLPACSDPSPIRLDEPVVSGIP